MGSEQGELFSLLNPINHSSTRAGYTSTKSSPMLQSATFMQCRHILDAAAGHGTQAQAGWMYRAGLESILGFKLHGDKLTIDPCVPRWWRDFGITYRRGRAVYEIKGRESTGDQQGSCER
jgi:cyclic beta-1,2-glucan synthetase